MLGEEQSCEALSVGADGPESGHEKRDTTSLKLATCVTRHPTHPSTAHGSAQLCKVSGASWHRDGSRTWPG